tara:strand:- start:3498 stop:3950 length:453 start_codon:yes stop_codon:yes gene_type:complete
MSNKQVGFFNGNLGIGTKHPQSSVHIDRNDAMILPKGTTSQRPVQQLTDGMIRYNSTNNNVEAYSQNKWVRLAEADAQSEFRLEQAKMTNENGNLQPTWANSVAVEMNFNKVYMDELYLKKQGSDVYYKITIDVSGNLDISGSKVQLQSQ